MDSIYQRTEQLIGKNALEMLKNTKVCIVGVGGVGSYTLEALARTGIGQITIIDKDVVDTTNINRQLIATTKNVGQPKVEQAINRVKEINPEIKVHGIYDELNDSNVEQYITSGYDYVIDAIDSVSSKIALIKRCKQLNIKVISSMGTANKLDPTKLKVVDISKTEMCPLAKVIRKKLKENNIAKVKVVFSTEQAIKNEGALGSVAYVTGTAGLIIASEVIKDLIQNE